MEAFGTMCNVWPPSGLADLIQQREQLDKKIKELRGQTLIECQSNVHGKGCGHKLAIGSLDYRVQMCYIPPTGCMEGDYWKEGDGEFICPNCLHRNRLYDRKEVKEHRFFFRSQIKEYPDD